MDGGAGDRADPGKVIMNHPVHLPVRPAPRQSPLERVWEITPEFAPLLTAAGLNSVDAILDYAGGESLAKPGLAAWRERIRLSLADRNITKVFYLKRFIDPPPAARRQARRCGNGARSVAGVEWNWLRRFRAAAIPCAQPVALAEEFVRGRERRSALLMAAVPGRSLEAIARDANAVDRQRVARWIAATAALAARMHGLGCVHRDFYLAHLFDAAPGSSGDGGTPVGRADRRHSTPEGAETSELFIIDLQRVFRPDCCRTRWVVKDLAALYFSALDLMPAAWVTRSDALRWLKQYLGVRTLDAQARRLAYCVIGRTQRMLRRHGTPRNTL